MEENKTDSNKLERILIWIAFGSLASQFILFFIFKSNNDGVSSFGDFFGFSAAFLSALVIVLLIRELKEQRESRVKLEKSFDDNADTLKTVKEFFESQSEYQKRQINFLSEQSNHLNVERLNNKYKIMIENLLYFKTQFSNHRSISYSASLNNFLEDLDTILNYESGKIFKELDKLLAEKYKIEEYMKCIIDITTNISNDIFIYGKWANIDDLNDKNLIDFAVDDMSVLSMQTVLNNLISFNSILNIEDKLFLYTFLSYYEKRYNVPSKYLISLIFNHIEFKEEYKITYQKLELSNHNLFSKVRQVIRKIDRLPQI